MASLTLWTLPGLWGCESSCRRVADLDFIAPGVSVYPDQLPAGDAAFAVVGDTQRTSWQECAIGREVNDDETEVIIAAIADADPAFLVHLGDLVFYGASAVHWHFFDHLAEPLVERQLPLLPVLGNHEYWGLNADAREHIEARFPRLKTQDWFTERHGRLGLVWLNSNRDDLPEGGWDKQVAWFEETMEALEADPEVLGVMVFAHHAPFTNSEVVDGDEDVRRDFVERLCDSPKALAMMTGHAHGFEHVVRGPDEGCGDRPVHFIVSGGGGGPRPGGLRSASETGVEDRFEGPTPRPFNFLMVAQDDTGVHITMHGMDKGESETRLITEWQIPL